MVHINSFGIIGGDKRQLYCAKSIAKDGYSVYIYGFDKCSDNQEFARVGLDEIAQKCDALILPLPVSKDGKTLNAPFASEQKAIDEKFFSYLEGKPIFAGMKSRLPYQSDKIYDYSTREEFAVENAVPTSEGAVEYAMREYEGTICSSNCLVTGYGRIGRVLSQMLKGLGANVTVSARKLRDLAFIRAGGCNAVLTSSLGSGYDIIFNTVPDMIFDSHTLAKTAAGSVVIDLASLPGGVDFDAAKRLNIKAVRALSLPGRVAPQTSGIIIKNAVYHIIEEEKL